MQTSKDSFLIPKGGSFLSKEGSCKPQKILSSSPERDFVSVKRGHSNFLKILSSPLKVFIPVKRWFIRTSKRWFVLSSQRDFNLTERDYLYLQRDSSLPSPIFLYPKDVDSNLEGVMPPKRGVVQVSKDVLHHTHNISIMT